MLENSFIIDKITVNKTSYAITANKHTLESLANRNFQGNIIVSTIKNIVSKLTDSITYGVICNDNKKLLVIKSNTVVYIITGLSQNMVFQNNTKIIKERNF